MNWYTIFYWLVVADNAKALFITGIVIFTLISILATICYIMNVEEGDEANQRMSRKWMWYSYPFMILFWSLFLFTPSRKDSLLIIAGGGALEFLTTDSSAQQLPHQAMEFVVGELRTMAKETQVDLGIATQKERILEEAKKMTNEQLLQRVQVDTVFARIVLDNINSN